MLTPFWVALQLLTRLPVPAHVFDGQSLRDAPLWFPLVGAVLGLLLWSAYALLAPWLPEGLARTAVLALGVALTGALHLDGLCDATDGLFGGRDRDGVLRIMRDPHAGAIGTVCVIVVLLLKQSALLALPAGQLGGSLVLACVAGRSLMLAALMLPPARSDGLGHAAAQPRSALRGLVCGAGVCAPALAWLGTGALAPMALGVAASGALLHIAWRALGGVTGDICGAAGELGETGFLIGTAGLLAAGAPTVGGLA